MEFDMRALPVATRYKIITSTITPRPIAWVTTLSADGVPNAAPYSFFNAVGHVPALIVLGLMKHPVTGELKDTATNITATGEFVVNLVSEDDAEKMNLSSAPAPSDVDEASWAGIETVPSKMVKPERIASSPVNFECKCLDALDYGPGQTLIVGEILYTHVRDEFISDKERLHFDTPAMRLIGRTHGSGWYARTTDQFQLKRADYDPSF